MGNGDQEYAPHVPRRSQETAQGPLAFLRSPFLWTPSFFGIWMPYGPGYSLEIGIVASKGASGKQR